MSLWNDIWRLFFPQCCLICGRMLTEGEEHLCIQCLSKLPRTRLNQQKDNDMEKNFWGKFPVVRAGAFLFYAKGGDVQKLLFALKYYGNSKLGHFLGRCIAREWQPSGFFEGVDAIVPVPLHRRKQRMRGYNQSRILAEGIASVTHIPLWDNLLVRSQFTETQTHKGRYERWVNVADVFACTSPEALRGKHILLVDDVITSGATMLSCMRQLTPIRGCKASVFALGWAHD